jgi:hypothetical protein
MITFFSKCYLMLLQEDGLKLTRAWLKRHAPSDEEVSGSDARYHKLQVQRVMNDAYLEMLEWDDEYHVFPETLVMDTKRILALRDATERTAVGTAVILLTFSNVQGFIVPMDAQKLKGKQILRRSFKVLETRWHGHIS